MTFRRASAPTYLRGYPYISIQHIVTTKIKTLSGNLTQNLSIMCPLQLALGEATVHFMCSNIYCCHLGTERNLVSLWVSLGWAVKLFIWLDLTSHFFYLL